MTGSAIFLDTSIQIARFFHSPQTKQKIQERVDTYTICATSLVVRQEFKRRIMREARYLLSLFHRWKSFLMVRRWVDSVLPTQHNRKRNICLALLDTIGEIDGEKESDADTTDRAVSMLELLLEFGMQDFDDSVDHIFAESGCHCAREPVRVYRNGKVDLGIEKCSRTEGQCGITEFLQGNVEILETIRQALAVTTPAKLSNELRMCNEFIAHCLTHPDDVEKRDPCTKVGDLLIALESRSIDTFYTLNETESQFFCPILHQHLIVRPVNYTYDDKILL